MTPQRILNQPLTSDDDRRLVLPPTSSSSSGNSDSSSVPSAHVAIFSSQDWHELKAHALFVETPICHPLRPLEECGARERIGPESSPTHPWFVGKCMCWRTSLRRLPHLILRQIPWTALAHPRQLSEKSQKLVPEGGQEFRVWAQSSGPPGRVPQVLTGGLNKLPDDVPQHPVTCQNGAGIIYVVWIEICPKFGIYCHKATPGPPVSLSLSRARCTRTRCLPVIVCSACQSCKGSLSNRLNKI